MLSTMILYQILTKRGCGINKAAWVSEIVAVLIGLRPSGGSIIEARATKIFFFFFFKDRLQWAFVSIHSFTRNNGAPHRIYPYDLMDNCLNIGILLTSYSIWAWCFINPQAHWIIGAHRCCNWQDENPGKHRTVGPRSYAWEGDGHDRSIIPSTKETLAAWWVFTDEMFVYVAAILFWKELLAP